MALEMRPVVELRMELICGCCGQPYYPVKCWEDQLQAVLLGQEKFAICPICTQAPPAHVFPTAGYRARCIYEVRRLQRLWEAAQREERDQNRSMQQPRQPRCGPRSWMGC